MNRIPSSIRQYIAALRLLLVFTVICGIAYPVVMWGVAQAAFKNQADGSLVTYKGQVVGSSLLCQEFVNAKGDPLPQYFQPRPSAATSGACHRLRLRPRLLGRGQPRPEQPDPGHRRQAAPGPDRGVRPRQVSQIPPDAVTSSGSGLDPDISPANAAIQVDRVAATRHLPVSEVQKLVAENTKARDIEFLGEPGVDVLTLNIALDNLPGQAQYVGGALSK